jgi:hypothetical protein
MGLNDVEEVSYMQMTRIYFTFDGHRLLLNLSALPNVKWKMPPCASKANWQANGLHKPICSVETFESEVWENKHTPSHLINFTEMETQVEETS